MYRHGRRSWWRTARRRVAVPHVLLDAEVRDAEVDAQRGGHSDRREVACTVRAGAHAVQVGQGEDSAQVGDAAGVDTEVRM